MQPIHLIFLSLADFLSGLIDSVAGGGGLISLPALLACGVPAQAALGTNKFQSAFGTSCALANFWRKSKVVWKIALAGIPFSLAASVADTKLALIIPQTILAKVLVVILPPAAVLMFVSRGLIRFKDPDAEQARISHQFPTAAADKPMSTPTPKILVWGSTASRFRQRRTRLWRAKVQSAQHSVGYASALFPSRSLHADVE